MNVRIQCSCMESGGAAVGTIRWYDPNGTRLVSARNTEKYNPDVPHFTRVNADSDENIILHGHSYIQ